MDVLPFISVRPLGGVSLSRFAGLVFSHLRWPLLTPVRYPGMLPRRAPFPQKLPTGQVFPDKNVNCDEATAAFTISPESRALSCCADLPGDSASYAVSVRRVCLLCTPVSFGRSLTVPLLPSTSICVNDNPLTGFRYRGLSPHKFSPMPGVPQRFQWKTESCH